MWSVRFFPEDSETVKKIHILDIQNMLYIYDGCVILRHAKRRRSILVSTAASEGGPKNPLKGIPMKPVVPA